jgi:hypothetical protein
VVLVKWLVALSSISFVSACLFTLPAMACARAELRDENGNVLSSRPDPLIVFGVIPPVSDPLLVAEAKRLPFNDVIVDAVARVSVPEIKMLAEEALPLPSSNESPKVKEVVLACDGTVLSETML